MISMLSELTHDASSNQSPDSRTACKSYDTSVTEVSSGSRHSGSSSVPVASLRETKNFFRKLFILNYLKKPIEVNNQYKMMNHVETQNKYKK